MKLKIVVHEEDGGYWAEQLRKMAEAGDDNLIDEETPTTWDEERGSAHLRR